MGMFNLLRIIYKAVVLFIIGIAYAVAMFFIAIMLFFSLANFGGYGKFVIFLMAIIIYICVYKIFKGRQACK